MSEPKKPHPTRIFKKPLDLVKAWDKYKLSLIEYQKKWINIQYVGKDGDKKQDSPKAPLTFEGFKRYCYDNYGNVEQYFVNAGEYYTDFISVCSRIKNEIREDQITGGLLGFYNPSITQRLNGLSDKTEIDAEIRQSPFKGIDLNVSTDDSTE